MKKFVIVEMESGDTVECNQKLADRLDLFGEQDRIERLLEVACTEAYNAFVANPSGENWDYYSDIHKDLYGVRPTYC